MQFLPSCQRFHLGTAMEPLKTAALISLLNLFCLLPLSLMVVLHTFGAPTLSITVLPASTQQSMKKFLESEVGQALCRFMGREALYILALGIDSLFVVTVSICLVVAFCNRRRHLTIKDVARAVLDTWKGLIITWIYVALLAISYALSMVFLISNSVRVFKDIVLNVMVLLMVAFFSMHLIVAWIMESVTEVLEENSCELDGTMAGEEEYQSMLKIEEGREEGGGQRTDAVDNSGRIQFLKFLLVSTVCGLVSCGLIEFGVNEDNERMKIKTVITIMSTCLFLFSELLIFVVFIAFYWGLKKAMEERWRPKNKGFSVLWLPSVMVLVLLLLDQRRIFSYFDICKVL